MKLVKKAILLFLLVASSTSLARDYFIYSIMHELPMGSNTEKPRKNLYLNIGTKQGLEKGTTLNVFRRMIRNDPYESKKRYNYQVKIGEIEIIHSDEAASIAVSKVVYDTAKTPLFDIPNFMVGDEVKVKLK